MEVLSTCPCPPILRAPYRNLVKYRAPQWLTPLFAIRSLKSDAMERPSVS